jgi:hypothetical protein
LPPNGQCCHHFPDGESVTFKLIQNPELDAALERGFPHLRYGFGHAPEIAFGGANAFERLGFSSRQVVEIGQVLVAASRLLVGLQVRQANDVHLDSFEVCLHPARKTLREGHLRHSTWLEDSADNNRLNSGGNRIVAISDLTQLFGRSQTLRRRFAMPENAVFLFRFLTTQQADGRRFDGV